MYIKINSLCQELNRSLNDDNIKNANQFPVIFPDQKIVKFILWCEDFDISKYNKEDIFNGITLVQQNIHKEDNLEIYAYTTNDNFVLIDQLILSQFQGFISSKYYNDL